MEPLIQFEAVSKRYRMGEVQVSALDSLDLPIAAGEFVVLLGPSGCGKTTALNLLGGLDRPTGGHILVHGHDITRDDDAGLTKYRRQTVGLVFQFFNLIPTLTAAENIEFALALTRHGKRHSRALELLELVGLAERANHFPAQLSGGQQQRVAIARALANEPPILLCDEPTGNLDSDTGHQVLSVLRDLNQRQGTTVLLVTHNAAIAPMADRVVRLRNGGIERIETVDAPRAVAELVW
ncbi:MAG TPA: ABC transporter ATP-binding protein [Nitrolancea sp.]